MSRPEETHASATRIGLASTLRENIAKKELLIAHTATILAEMRGSAAVLSDEYREKTMAGIDQQARGIDDIKATIKSDKELLKIIDDSIAFEEARKKPGFDATAELHGLQEREEKLKRLSHA